MSSTRRGCVAVSFGFGVGAIRSYRRLSYTPWHAMAEFVDNSTQSYENHKDELDAAYAAEGKQLVVSIAYDRKEPGLLRVADNAMGMSLEELDRALEVGLPPENQSGRSEYGMGMKTAACWVGNLWTVRTKKLGETTEYQVTIDIDKIATGEVELPLREVEKPAEEHYTVIEVTNHNHKWQGRTLGKIRDFLSSMYRVDLREERMQLMWQGEPLTWEDKDEIFVKAADGTRYKKKFDFEVDGKKVYGWVGVLDRGSRARAGFSILRRGRVVRGWPDSWRPEAIFGQLQGSNDLVNQRLTGEINLDAFTVTHTKDDILWMGDEEERVQKGLKDGVADYAEVAKKRRKGSADERGPSKLEIETALQELQAELSSDELIDTVQLADLPSPEVIKEGFGPLNEQIDPLDPAFSADIGDIRVSGYLALDASANDPYVAVDATEKARVSVIINMAHPRLKQLSGSEGVLNYFRDCTYDAIAEWQATHKGARLDPDTIKILKDRLLRLSFDIEMHLQASSADEATTAAEAS